MTWKTAPGKQRWFQILISGGPGGRGWWKIRTTRASGRRVALYYLCPSHFRYYKYYCELEELGGVGYLLSMLKIAMQISKNLNSVLERLSFS